MAGTIKNGKNGTVWKWIAGALFTLLLASAVWTWKAGGEAATVVGDVRVNKKDIAENKSNINDDLKPGIGANRESIIGIGKDIEQLQEKVGELKTVQTQMITEQRAAFEKVMERLPINKPPGG